MNPKSVAGQKIKWSKKYQEDFGAKDENGEYTYVYRYHIYWFSLDDNRKIRARRYTDTPDQCSLFGAPEELNFKNPGPDEYLSAIVNFLLMKEGAKKIEYFKEGYKPVDLTKIKNNLNQFVFENVANAE